MLIAIVLFLVFIFFEKNSSIYTWQISHENQLDKRTVHILKEFTATNAVKFDVYTAKDSLIAKKIIKFFSPMKKINNNIEINFIDPLINPSESELNGISMQGEMVLSFRNNKNNKQIHITELSQTAVTNALLTLKNNENKWIVFAEGYGMRSVDDITSLGLSNLLVYLKKTGRHVARMTLSPAVTLPENVQLIVLPSPKETLSQDITTWLKTQANKGISVLWLSDLNMAPQPYLELFLDVLIGDKKYVNGKEYSAMLDSYGVHKITEEFNQPIYLAQVQEIIAQKATSFVTNQSKSALFVAQEFNGFRTVITGDVDFISNQFLNSAANRSMIERIVDWLLHNDDRINIPVQINNNKPLYLTHYQLLFLSVFFLILLPLLSLGIAWKQWRHHSG